MDREAKEEYHVVIQAKDMGGHMGGLSGTTRVTITLTDVNDNSAKFPKSKESKLVFDNDHCSARTHSSCGGYIRPTQDEDSKNGFLSLQLYMGNY